MYQQINKKCNLEFSINILFVYSFRQSVVHIHTYTWLQSRFAEIRLIRRSKWFESVFKHVCTYILKLFFFVDILRDKKLNTILSSISPLYTLLIYRQIYVHIVFGRHARIFFFWHPCDKNSSNFNFLFAFLTITKSMGINLKNSIFRHFSKRGQKY